MRGEGGMQAQPKPLPSAQRASLIPLGAHLWFASATGRLGGCALSPVADRACSSCVDDYMMGFVDQATQDPLGKYRVGKQGISPGRSQLVATITGPALFPSSMEIIDVICLLEAQILHGQVMEQQRVWF